MPEVPSSSSFIPKRSTGQTVRRRKSSNFFVLSIVSYACLIAAPTVAAAVYVYGIYTDRQFDEVVVTLDAAVADFKQADLARVLEFDARLKKTNDLMDSHVSLGQVLQALENSTLQSVAFEDLTLTRIDLGTVEVTANLSTVDFDAALSQRTEYSNNATLVDSALSDIVFLPESTESESGNGEQQVTMVGTFTFDTGTLLYNPTSVAEIFEETSVLEESAPDIDSPVVNPETI